MQMKLREICHFLFGKGPALPGGTMHRFFLLHDKLILNWQLGWVAAGALLTHILSHFLSDELPFVAF